MFQVTENADPDKHSYSVYNIGLVGSGFGKNVIIIGVDNISSTHADNRKKDTLILGTGPIDGLDDTKLTVEAEYSINFREQQKKFRLSLHCNGTNSYLFVNGVKPINSKEKIVN